MPSETALLLSFLISYHFKALKTPIAKESTCGHLDHNRSFVLSTLNYTPKRFWKSDENENEKGTAKGLF